jgi:hypothetical protein
MQASRQSLAVPGWPQQPTGMMMMMLGLVGPTTLHLAYVQT